MKFIVEDDFWELFPTAKIGVVLCFGIDNKAKDESRYVQMIRDAEKEAMNFLPGDEFSQNPVIKVWRDAFTKFKTKKGARASIEAMMKRVSGGNQIGTINPLVDIYNSVSLKHALPAGGEDIDTFVGDMRLTRAIGGEEFLPLGESESAPPYPGEVVYKDDKGAICRCWNWRESVRTMLTEDTANAFLCVELVDDSRQGSLDAALSELETTVCENLGGTCKSFVLDCFSKSIEIR